MCSGGTETILHLHLEDCTINQLLSKFGNRLRIMASYYIQFFSSPIQMWICNNCALNWRLQFLSYLNSLEVVYFPWEFDWCGLLSPIDKDLTQKANTSCSSLSFSLSFSFLLKTIECYWCGLLSLIEKDLTQKVNTSFSSFSFY